MKIHHTICKSNRYIFIIFITIIIIILFLFKYNRSHNETESSILAPELMDSLLISSPGNCTIKIEDEDDDDDDEKEEENYENISPNNNVIKPKFIKTPVIKCVPSTIKPKNTTQIYDIPSTPLRSFPVEPTYSPYYYDRK